MSNTYKSPWRRLIITTSTVTDGRSYLLGSYAWAFASSVRAGALSPDSDTLCASVCSIFSNDVSFQDDQSFSGRRRNNYTNDHYRSKSAGMVVAQAFLRRFHG